MTTDVAMTTDGLLREALRDPQGRGPLLQHCGNYLRLLAGNHFDRRLRARVGASDVVQDTLLEAHRDFDQFRGKSSAEFLAWLRQILIHNLARLVDRHVGAGKRDVRREQALDRLSDSVNGSAQRLARLLPQPGSSPSAAAMQHEELLALADALLELPPDYYHVIVFRHLEGMPFREIGERLERSEGAVRMLWFRAMEQLRKLLCEKGMI